MREIAQLYGFADVSIKITIYFVQQQLKSRLSNSPAQLKHRVKLQRYFATADASCHLAKN